MKKSKIKYFTLLGIFAICLIGSIVLSFVPPEEACGGVDSSCYVVQTSSYEKTLGTNNAYFGLIAFSALILLCFSYIKNEKKYKKKMVFFGVVIGSIFSAYFIYLQFFKIRAVCKYCMVIDIGMILSLLIMLIKDND